MALGAFIKTFIYLVSSSLLFPVLFMLAILIVWMIVYAGGFFAEWLERFRMEKVLPENLPDRIQAQPDGPFLSQRCRGYVRRLQKVLAGHSWSEEKVENVLQDATQRVWKSLDRLRILVRVAPGLGLIGTLIPMGTGLAALGQGDMSKLTSDLVIAFTTTVVGLALGLLAFFFLTIRSRWVEEDVKNMELATEILTQTPEIQDHDRADNASQSTSEALAHMALQRQKTEDREQKTEERIQFCRWEN